MSVTCVAGLGRLTRSTRLARLYGYKRARCVGAPPDTLVLWSSLIMIDYFAFTYFPVDMVIFFKFWVIQHSRLRLFSIGQR